MDVFLSGHGQPRLARRHDRRRPRRRLLLPFQQHPLLSTVETNSSFTHRRLPLFQSSRFGSCSKRITLDLASRGAAGVLGLAHPLPSCPSPLTWDLKLIFLISGNPAVSECGLCAAFFILGLSSRATPGCALRSYFANCQAHITGTFNAGRSLRLLSFAPRAGPDYAPPTRL
jgi:hypothetical protein